MLTPQLIKTLAKIYRWENQNDEDDGNPEETAVFHRLLDTVRSADANETAHALIKRLGSEKILPGSNETDRTWLVRILAEPGVLPNRLAPDYSILHAFYPYDQIRRYEDELHSRLPARADPVFPASAWHGAPGINEGIVRELTDGL
ncbi:hypothetical protein HMPREF9123_1682 [Neisseria bacilliformis ATCC BAA-1200]|uniref:Uncharacterized protein n=1 Tax=Neisseria bacilliformis ATCC BAA-1200 TaxID=888742 RepID=F2BD76_9NEIS|nr:hypothetical protein [Neisseria bacilliformis]EGF10611.1 hypothetical protein HMPREF9123_1682 [Neisseria bacilliformis ATCC BAA-1200]QMT48615.1 hypothetical protein H3L91_05900 [Neisseria bacilliformis]